MKGKELMSMREKNITEGRHPYHGISDNDAEILHKYEEWEAGVFI